MFNLLEPPGEVGIYIKPSEIKKKIFCNNIFVNFYCYAGKPTDLLMPLQEVNNLLTVLWCTCPLDFSILPLRFFLDFLNITLDSFGLNQFSTLEFMRKFCHALEENQFFWRNCCARIVFKLALYQIFFRLNRTK